MILVVLLFLLPDDNQLVREKPSLLRIYLFVKAKQHSNANAKQRRRLSRKMKKDEKRRVESRGNEKQCPRRACHVISL
jgi:hypothetical protein